MTTKRQNSLGEYRSKCDLDIRERYAQNLYRNVIVKWLLYVIVTLFN